MISSSPRCCRIAASTLRLFPFSLSLSFTHLSLQSVIFGNWFPCSKLTVCLFSLQTTANILRLDCSITSSMKTLCMVISWIFYSSLAFGCFANHLRQWIQFPTLYPSFVPVLAYFDSIFNSSNFIAFVSISVLLSDLIKPIWNFLSIKILKFFFFNLSGH